MKFLIGIIIATSFLMSCSSSGPGKIGNTYIHTSYADSLKVANGERPDYEHKRGYDPHALCNVTFRTFHQIIKFHWIHISRKHAIQLSMVMSVNNTQVIHRFWHK